MASVVLKYDTPEELQKAIETYNDYMTQVPEEFSVRGEYLGKLTEAEFCREYNAFKNLVLRMYSELYANPERIGLIKTNKKGEQKIVKSQRVTCIKKLFYCLGISSTYKNEALVVKSLDFARTYYTFFNNTSIGLSDKLKDIDLESLDKFIQRKQLHKVISYIEDFGFTFHGFNANKSIKHWQDCRVTYSKSPRMLWVIKAFSMPKLCRISFEMDYARFNYKVFAHKKKARLPLEDLVSFNLISSEEHKCFLIDLNHRLEKIGISYGEAASGWYHGTLPCQYNYKNKIRILQNMEYGIIPYILMDFRNKEEEGIKIIQSIPYKFRKNIPTCKGCKKECKSRVVIEVDNIKYALCYGMWWQLPFTTGIIDFIEQAITI